MKFTPASLALVAVLAVASAARADGLPYHIDDTIVGSMVPETIMRSAVPVDTRYADMTPEQKAQVAGEYKNLGAGVEPPYPAYGLRHMVKPLVRYADLIAPVGSLELSVASTRRASRRRQRVQVARSKLSLLAAQMLAQEQFKPATCQGEPCAMAYVLRLDFPSRHGQPVTMSGPSAIDPLNKGMVSQ